MPFIKVDLGDAQEQENVPEGSYDLRIIKVEDKDSKSGNPMTVCTIKVEDPEYANARLINHFIVQPSKDHTPEVKAMMILNTARFLHTFNIPYTDQGYNSDDLQGATASDVLVKLEPSADNETILFNRVVPGPLPKEG